MYGRVGYVDFQDYFSASILTQLKEWFLPTPIATWGNIESTYSTYGPTNLWLFGAQLGVRTPSYLPPTTIVSIKTWLRLLTSKNTNDPKDTLITEINCISLAASKEKESPERCRRLLLAVVDNNRS